MQRRSFIVHTVGSSNDDPISPDELFDVVFDKFPDVYVDVREFTDKEYLGISEPDGVE
jgi:hypothetical protein